MPDRVSVLRSKIEELRQRERELEAELRPGRDRDEVRGQLASVRDGLTYLRGQLAEAESFSLTGDGEQRP